MAAMTISNSVQAHDAPTIPERAPQYRYFVVFCLVFGSVVFLIAAPAADWSRALVAAIEGGALVVTVATSRERENVRRHRAVVTGLVMTALVMLIGFGVLPRWFISLTGALITAAIPIALVRGLLRLFREAGVTVQGVAGSLAIYLSIGVVFAWVIGFVSQVQSSPYFAQHTSGTQGDKVYFSFTVLTTTGFGDFTPATAAGHAIAVIEMLTGQLYLVTVIGLVIGSFTAARRMR
jgi:Ion channel